MEGAERRGFVIMRRIGDKFESNGLRTVPDFQSAWIDALVSIELTEESAGFVGNPGEAHIRVSDDCNNSTSPEISTTQDGLGSPDGEMDTAAIAAAPVAEV